MGEHDALGMIETIGFPALVAALDSAAKTADVKVKTYQGADAGLVTIYLVGDVASVKVAVEVGAESARRVGHLHGKHVIARPDESTIQLILGETPKQPAKVVEQEVAKAKETETPEPAVPVEQKPVDNAAKNQATNKAQEETSIETYRKKTLKELRDIASKQANFPLTDNQLTKARKDEIIQQLMQVQAKKGGDKE